MKTQEKLNSGLTKRYNVERVDGKPVGECIVLEFRDPNARPAIAAFADAVEKDGYVNLANDLRTKLSSQP